MSQKERVRLSVMKQVEQEELKLVEASDLLGLSYRQAKRVWARYRLQGDEGLVHAARGKPGKRCKPAKLKARILARYDERYPDFGPTLAAEYMAEEGLVVDHETLRRWLLAKGKPRMRRRRQRHREWRERKPCFGAMVQLDGSHHDWFEGRAVSCVLMVMVDDATNRVWAQFFEEETTRASYDILEGWVRRWGLPQSLYVDKDSIYRCEGLGSIAEQMAGKEPRTQFGRAMEQLGVELILASSPQAKGRVERMNGTLQDRLVKALRLEGLNDMASANEFLAKKFLPGLNRKFDVEPASQADAHRGIPRELNQVLSWEEQRVVQKDWTVVCQNQWYQLEREHEPLGLVGKKIIVRTLRDGTVQLVREGVKLRFRKLSGRPQRKEKPREAQAIKASAKPVQAHPWRQPLLRAGREAKRAAALLGMGDSGQPPLRSGFPPSPIPNTKSRIENQCS
ncbi:MAG TPA: ISNCY family transposase [Terriglobales bacterium]|nr:ISNCY family transposase [Terriglobales bacterium]